MSHFHKLDNTIICQLDSPGLNFTLVCALTAEESDAIDQGDTLLDIHDGPGQGADQVLAGLLLPPP